VKFCVGVEMIAAPREVWASALKASDPASRTAAVAVRTTISLRNGVLPSFAETFPHEKHCAKRGQHEHFNIVAIIIYGSFMEQFFSSKFEP